MPLRSNGFAVALCLSAVLTTSVTTSSAYADVPNKCGGALTDYVSTAAGQPDSAFIGKITDGSNIIDLKVTPVWASSNTFRAETGTGDSGAVRSAGFWLTVNSSGQGVVNFQIPTGKAISTQVTCKAGLTRVIQINGSAEVGNGRKAPFMIKRS
ncbi:hypothetical protein ACIRP0_23325 [Streptomyces sp. NPDC101733]|uniref:hypothetical protein n=1 Tax=unclassified Streptomyces TaxID=2593676 RepID=UPI00380DB753